MPWHDVRYTESPYWGPPQLRRQQPVVQRAVPAQPHEIYAVPEYAFGRAEAERYRKLLEAAIGQAEMEARGEAGFQRGLIERQYPRVRQQLLDALAGRGILFSGITTRKEGELEEQKLLDIGRIERQLASALAQAAIERAMGQVAFGDRLDQALLNALRAEYQASLGVIS